MKILKVFFGRIGLTILLIVLELFWLLTLLKYLSPYMGWIEAAVRIIGILIVIHIVNHSVHLSNDLMWIILIMAFPIPGTIIYLFFSVFGEVTNKTFRGIIKETEIAKKYYHQSDIVLQEAEKEGNTLSGQIDYISKYAGFPVYQNTGFDYYDLGENGYPVMLEEMRKAKKYIFLEYFIIEPGQMWDSMLEILKEKASQGLEIRVMYDDMGSMNTLPARYVKTLSTYGIKACAFNRINPIINGIMNHRDHRKIMVIDGQVAFSGGINLSDEYINVKKVYGQWKDNCIRIKGEAVWSYLIMFLTMWNALKHEDVDYKKYRSFPLKGKADGYIVPYAQTPFNKDSTAQNVYENILNQAQKYCYIFTPYLIIDSNLTNTLTLAAKRGVDVKIITPGIPDKKIIFGITRSYYQNLIDGGVEIYEYTPGFDHAKVFVCDDRIATVGTINLDYRSLYLHFENGTYLLDSKKVLDIRDDFLEALSQSHRIHMAEIRKNFFVRIFISLIRIFSPMM